MQFDTNLTEQVANATQLRRRDELEFDFSTKSLQRVADGFRRGYTGMPNCVGAIDGTHFNMLQPHACGRTADYRDRKGHYSIIMQAVTDSNCRFSVFFIGEPGSDHDTRVLHKSMLWRKAQQGLFWRQPVVAVDDMEFAPFILGDAGYPLLPWLMVPYMTTASLTTEQYEYNQWHSSTRMVVERSFGLLKGRWRVLLGCAQISDPNRLAHIATACVALHNFCLSRRDELDDAPTEDDLGLVAPSLAFNASARAVAVHDQLVHYLQQHRPDHMPRRRYGTAAHM